MNNSNNVNNNQNSVINQGANNQNVTNNNMAINTTPVNPQANQQVNQQANVNIVPETNNQEPKISIKPIEPTGTAQNNNGNKKDKLRTILLISFFIFTFVFIFFLPTISSFLNDGNIKRTNTEVENGILVCDMDKESDETKTIYEYTLNFTSKKLMSSSYNITVESEDKKIIKEKRNECDNVSQIAEEINGIDVECTSSSGIATNIESYDHKIIDNSKLTKFTEAGGIYPEFKYKENIYTIKGKLIRTGYDCKITAK